MTIKYFFMEMSYFVDDNTFVCKGELTEEEFKKISLYPKYKVWKIETHIINGYWKPSGHKEPECHVYIFI